MAELKKTTTSTITIKALSFNEEKELLDDNGFVIDLNEMCFKAYGVDNQFDFKTTSKTESSVDIEDIEDVEDDFE